MAKRTTVDQLAVMVTNGFEALQNQMRERFQALQDEIRGRFVVVEGEFRDLSTHSGRIERKLDSAIERLDDHSIRLGRLEESTQG